MILHDRETEREIEKERDWMGQVLIKSLKLQKPLRVIEVIAVESASIDSNIGHS